jgi:HSP20 family protein
MARSKGSKTRGGQDEVRKMTPTRVDDKGRYEQRSLRLNDLFNDFRRDIEDAMNPWSSMLGWRFPRETRMIRPYGTEEPTKIARTPLIDMRDKGDRYDLRLELPGIDKDKIRLDATDESIEISGEQSEESEDTAQNYIYNERSYKSFYRTIPIPEEIIPSKVRAKMNNGILQVDIPKKVPSSTAGEGKRIKIE